MAFKADSQTINDLKIIGDSKGNDIYTLFNRTRTRGGASILKDMFLYPLSRAEDIRGRVSTIKYFCEGNICFPFRSDLFDTIEFYLSNTDERSRLTVHEDTLKRKFDNIIGSDTDYRQIKKGVTSTLQFLVEMRTFLSQLEATRSKDKGGISDVSQGTSSEIDCTGPSSESVTSSSTVTVTDTALGVAFVDFHKDLQSIKEVLCHPELSFTISLTDRQIKHVSYVQVAEYDQLFRFTIHKELLKLLYYAYEIDVFISVAETSKEQGFSFAQIEEGEENIIELQGVYHPLVPHAIPNDITITEANNMVFLTGANMAGKSTFMKTFSIAIYLAHMGFPVPATSMRFSVQDGMFTTINLSDNLNLGFSHFYSEVLRVKKVAESLKTNERMIVVFDELFRGTNVKDAYDATVALSHAFAGKRKSTFVISTHIIEAGEALKELRDNIKFLYLPTVMKGNKPEYTYQLREGITSDRHGMVIIRNEGILDILTSDHQGNN
ncbi:MAG: DNA mismatch repair protein [Bacteroidales bacterium]|nr:DNA mismatch repair protein [Bacteroidales bacterium]MDD3990076.1 DNA mismatch repair protein [Bacteroidales bacterium]MDD4638374.1 DNA mismatch repair protein [Bacteroidales bacterium]